MYSVAVARDFARVFTRKLFKNINCFCNKKLHNAFKISNLPENSREIRYKETLHFAVRLT